MALDPLLFIGFALALGFKHSYDADHLVAVSNFLARSHSLRKTFLMSLSWAAGHMITATAITFVLFAFRATLLQGFLDHLELGVAIMLIAIGVIGLLAEFGWIHRHLHRHDSREHDHAHVHLRGYNEHQMMFGIGVVHGLASNDELLVLLLASLSVASFIDLVAGVGVFSLGVVAGMVVFGLGVTYPVKRWGTQRVRRAINVGAALLSLVYAAYLLLGFEVLNLLPGLSSPGAIP